MRRLLIGCLYVSAAPLAWAQATLSGTARTTDGLPLPQLVVQVEGAVGQKKATTGPDGRYRVGALASGEYRVRVLAPGLVLDGDTRVSLHGDTRLDLTLRPAPVKEQVVVSATRGEATASALGVSVTALDQERISEREPSSFLDLLRDVPGVTVARSGGLGSISSAFVRGGESSYARVMIDGVPVNEPGGYYNFASQFPLELGRVEVVRGATSSLYGTDALAGVVHLVTRHPEPGETRNGSAEAEAGGFSWKRGKGSLAGHSGKLDWNAGLVYLKTDNEQPNSAFEQTAGALALGLQLLERTTARAFLRAETSSAGTPGAVAYGRPDLDATSDHDELAGSLVLRHAGDRVAHELRAGASRTGQLSKNPLDSGGFTPRTGARVAPFASSDFPNPAGYQNDTGRTTLGYQLDAPLGASHLVSAGADVEHETGDIGDRRGPLLAPTRTNFGAYAQDRLALRSRLFLTLGGRVERNDSFGTRAVPRMALALRLGPTSRITTVRASAGAGIKEPSFLQSFGVSEFALGNPALVAERSRSYDVGVEQRAFRDRLRVEATFFHHDYRDQIAYKILSFDPFRGSYENLGRTRGRGLELALDAAPSARIRAGAQYTLLDGEILVSTSTSPLYAVGQPLLRRPKHQGSLWASATAARASLGLNLLLVGRRVDSDFFGIGLTENEAHARLDARVRVSVTRGVEAFAVAENLLDREYQEILGYPALGRALRFGVRYKSRGPRP
jgi:vitamin B12 transporter